VCNPNSCLRRRCSNSLQHIDEYCAGIPFKAFPKTLQDAILIAKRLDFRYLWIDALCIIQGDKEDWAEQAAVMTEIYQGSALTISALSSCDCDYGIMTKLPDHGFRIGTYLKLQWKMDREKG
jgi:hypothetical protein